MLDKDGAFETNIDKTMTKMVLLGPGSNFDPPISYWAQEVGDKQVQLHAVVITLLRVVLTVQLWCFVSCHC